jgi:hypothetical protein
VTVTMVVTSCRPCLTLNTGILKFFADPRVTVTVVVTSCRPCLTLNTGILQFFADPRDRDHGRDLLPAVPDPEHSNSNLKFVEDSLAVTVTVTVVVTSCRPYLTLNTGILKFFADPRDRDRDRGRDLLPAVPDPEHRNTILKFFADPRDRDHGRDFLSAVPALNTGLAF